MKKPRRAKSETADRRVILTTNETAALGGHCVDCGKKVFASDEYLVRSETWAAAGMGGWQSGLLHRTCLERRLGRKLRREEILVRFVRYVGKRAELSIRPEYLSSPEYLEHR
jgi:hypothetical protein